MSVLGMNCRNALIARVNPRAAIRRANDKFATKQALTEADVPVLKTIAFIRDRLDLAVLDPATLPDAFAIKPNRGGQGRGILLLSERDGDCWRTAGGTRYSMADLRSHARRILDAEFSKAGTHRDEVLIEALIRPASSLGALVSSGLPDVRVICLGATALMAMMRLPTERGGGRANLHRGAVGAAIDLRSGEVYRAALDRDEIAHHPDTGAALIGLRVPLWTRIMDAARRCAAPMGLGYLGVDLVLDERDGVKVLEVNAHPGLEIQNVCRAGLHERIEYARALSS